MWLAPLYEKVAFLTPPFVPLAHVRPNGPWLKRLQSVAGRQIGRTRLSTRTTLQGCRLKRVWTSPLTAVLLIPLALKAAIETEAGLVMLTVQSIRILYPLVRLVVMTPPVMQCVVQVVEWLIPDGLPFENVLLLRWVTLLQALMTTPCLARL